MDYVDCVFFLSLFFRMVGAEYDADPEAKDHRTHPAHIHTERYIRNNGFAGLLHPCSPNSAKVGPGHHQHAHAYHTNDFCQVSCSLAFHFYSFQLF